MPPPAVPLTFAALQRRLIRHIRALLANGEWTERRLARTVGLSQPHIHNVLKGARVLTPDVGDLMLDALGLSILEFAEPEELGQSLESRELTPGSARLVRMAEGCISPSVPFPDLLAGGLYTRLPADVVEAQRPVLVALDSDAETAPLFRSGCHGLLDLDEKARVRIDEGAWYVLRWGGAGFVRQLRREEGTLVVLGQRSWAPMALPERMPSGDPSLLSFVRARLIWTAPNPVTTPVTGYAGISRLSPTRS